MTVLNLPRGCTKDYLIKHYRAPSDDSLKKSKLFAIFIRGELDIFAILSVFDQFLLASKRLLFEVCLMLVGTLTHHIPDRKIPSQAYANTIETTAVVSMVLA